MSPRVGVWSLFYGLCVDVYHNEAWWEGVVFDQEDGFEERLIFLPSLGTEIKMGINMVRKTLDWNLTTGEVKPRGKWLFLVLVEELERDQEQPLGVSVKEIWLGVSAKEMWLALQYQVKDSTCSVMPLLSELVTETFKELVDSKASFTEFEAVSLNLLDFDDDGSNEKNLVNPDAVGAISTSSGGGSNTDCNKIDEKPIKSRVAGNWQLAGPDIIGIAKYCPNAVINYTIRRDPGAVEDIRKHLSYLGWKIEYISDKFRYTSPDGENRYYSLVKLCKYLRKSSTETPPSISQNETKSLLASTQNHIISSSSKVTNVCPQVKGLSSDDILVVEPEHCPEAVLYWYQHGSDKRRGSDMTLKVKKHLSFLRWVFWYGEKGNADKNRRELRYTSPSGATYYTLIAACKACIDGGQIPECKLSSSTASNAKLQESFVPSNAKSQESFVPSNAKLQEEWFVPSHAKLQEWFVSSNAKLQESFVPSNAKLQESFVPSNAKLQESFVPSNAKLQESFFPSNAKLQESYVPSNANLQERFVPFNAKLQERFVPSNVKQSSIMPQSKKRKSAYNFSENDYGSSRITKIELIE